MLTFEECILNGGHLILPQLCEASIIAIIPMLQIRDSHGSKSRIQVVARNFGSKDPVITP